MITSQKNFFPFKNSRSLVVVHTLAKASFSIFELLNSVFVSLLDKYIIGCPSCDNIPDIECSLASVVNVMSFFGSKIFTTGFFATITFNLSKAFCCFSEQINSAFFFLIACGNSPIPKKIQVLFYL